jgi:hypothetical protein
MSHHHRHPLHPSWPTSMQLPHATYGASLGAWMDPLSDADDNPVFLLGGSPQGGHAGRYRLACNTDGHSVSNSQGNRPPRSRDVRIP